MIIMCKYKRNWPCGLCGEDVIFEQAIGGHTVTCGCGTAVRSNDYDYTNPEKFIKIEE